MVKKLSFITTILLILVVFTSKVNAFEVTKSPDTVESGEVFEFELNYDEAVYLANAHLTYDSEVFKFVKCNTKGVEINQISDNEIAWIYTDLSKDPKGTKKISFTFSAIEVPQDVTRNFRTLDTIYITTDENVHELGEQEYPVTVHNKIHFPLPFTGGIGTIVFFVAGGSLIIAGAVILIKKYKSK